MTRPTPLRAAGRTVTHVVLWAALSGLGLRLGGLAWLPVWAAQGYLLQSAYSGLHDASHQSQFRSRRANRLAAVLWGAPLLLNASLWRAWHLEHHRSTATAEDPEPRAALCSPTAYVLALPVGGAAMLVTFWWQSLAALLGRPPRYARRHGVTASIRFDSLVVLAMTGLAVAGLARRPALVAALWLVPLAVYWLVVAVGIGLSEHHGTGGTGSQLEVTRSITTKRFMRFVQWNSNYHTAHHLVPSVSYTFLPELDAAIGDRAVHRSPSYLAFHSDQLRAIRRSPRRARSAAISP